MAMVLKVVFDFDFKINSHRNIAVWINRIMKRFVNGRIKTYSRPILTIANVEGTFVIFPWAQLQSTQYKKEQSSIVSGSDLLYCYYFCSLQLCYLTDWLTGLAKAQQLTKKHFSLRHSGSLIAFLSFWSNKVG